LLLLLSPYVTGMIKVLDMVNLITLIKFWLDYYTDEFFV
jgi:hypothetical protein